MSEAERHEFIIDANVSDGEWDLDRLLEQYGQDELVDFGLENLVKQLGGANEDDNEEDEEEEKDFSDVSVVVECPDEKYAEELYNKLVKEGYRCRISTL